MTQLTEEDFTRSENVTTRNVLHIHKVLMEHGPMPMCRFVVNPGSFSQTVENVFYLSFLVREGSACIRYEEDDGEFYVGTRRKRPFGSRTVAATTPATEDDYRGGAVKYQAIMDVTMNKWRAWIKHYNITETIIPTRAPAAVNLNARWYG